MNRLFLIAIFSISFSAAAIAAPLEGSWRGGYFCYPANYGFSLFVMPGDEADLVGELSYEMIDPAGRASRTGVVTSSGTYDPAAATFRLVPDRRQKRNPGRAYEIVALVDGDTLIGHFGNAAPGDCTFVLGSRSENIVIPDDSPLAISPAEMRSLRARQTKFLASAEAKKLCNRIIDWAARFEAEYGDTFRNAMMGKLYVAAYPLLGDAEFQAFYGKRYENVTFEERANIVALLRSHCRSRLRELGFGLDVVIGRFFQDATMQGGRRQSLSGAMGIRALRAWRDRSLRRIETTSGGADSIERLDGLRRAGEIHLAGLWPSEYQAFLAAVDARLDIILPDAARAKAEAAAVAAQGYEGFIALRGWSSDNAELLDRLKPDDRTAVLGVVTARLNVMLGELVDTDSASLPAAGEGWPALDANTQWYSEMSRRYGPSLGQKVFEPLLNEFRVRRHSALSSVAPEVVARIEAAKSGADIKRIVGSVLVAPGDRMSEPGKIIHEAATKTWEALETAQFMARFSPREQQLMSAPGQIAVPPTYPEPTAEEIRLAMLREMASMGGELKSANTAALSIPPFGALGFAIDVTLDDATRQTCRAAKDGGYDCAYTMPMRNRIPDQMRAFFASNPLYARMVDLAGAALDMQRDFTATDRFLLTSSGWRSPTAAARRLEGIVSHYETMGDALKSVADANCASLWGQTDWGQSVCLP